MDKQNNIFQKLFGKDSNFWKFPKQIHKHSKNVSLLELFFDIVIVVSLGGTVHELIRIFEKVGDENIIEYKNIMFSFLHIITLLLVWRGFTFYSSKYENPGVRHLLLTLLTMCFIAFASVGSWVSFSHDTTSASVIKKLGLIDTVGLIGSIFMLFYVNFSIWRTINNVYVKQKIFFNFLGPLVALGFLIAHFVVLLLTDSNSWTFYINFSLWLLALSFWVFCEYFSFSNKIFANHPGHVMEHIQERYSILFIVFAGEMLLNIITRNVNNIVNNKETVAQVVLNVAGSFIFIAAFWWVFNILFKGPEIENKPVKIFSFSIRMLNIYISLIIIATGLSLINDRHYGTVGKWTLYSGLLLYTISHTIVHMTMLDYNAKLKFVWPKWFQLTMKLSIVIFLAISLPVIFIDSYVLAFVIAIVYMYFYVFSFLVIRYVFFTRQKECNKFFEQEYKKYLKKQDIWIKKNIVPLIDYEFHKARNFEVNQFSKYVKKIK